MRRGWLIACALLACAALSACAGPQNDDIPAGRSDTRQQPSTTTPGVNLSGYINVGIKRRF